MKTTVSFLLSLLFAVSYAQDLFNIEIEALSYTGIPEVQSYSWAKTSDDKWVVFGGRTDGLHQRQPFAAFLSGDNNKSVNVIDPTNGQVWTKSLSGLSSSIYEQLQSTNQEFYQRENTLYILGGYGYSVTQNDHITHPYITAINVDSLANAVINNKSINSFFRQQQYSNFAVTGGQLGYLDSTFYLCGGQYFEGRYNPMGPNHGPGFIQNYTDAITTFKIDDDGTTMTIKDYNETTNANDLHRRDYNMSPQIFPNGNHGFTMFSGVFDANDLPWLHPVDVMPGSYSVDTSFSQYLSHYHSAKLPIYDSANNIMQTVFFGGMSQYTLDAGGNLQKDDDVPFVKTISKVSRNSNGVLQETKLNIEMPALLGSGAEFIPISDNAYFPENEILMINKVPQNKTLIGYIYGGIESTAPNIFFINNGTQSSASSKIFKVYINKSTVGFDEISLDADKMFNLKLFPNPTEDFVNAEFFIPNDKNHEVIVYNTEGVEITRFEFENSIGNKKIKIDLSNQPSGNYLIEVVEGKNSSVKRVIKQ